MMFLYKHNVSKHQSRPFSFIKWTFFLRFLNILLLECLKAKFEKNRPKFQQFFKNRPGDLQKSPKLNFSQQIWKDKNLKIPKHTNFLKIGQFLAILWPIVSGLFLKKNIMFFCVFFTKSIWDKIPHCSGTKNVPETCNTAIEGKFYVDLWD